MVLRLGVIGAGLKAADYASGWAAMPDVRIVAAAEVSEKSLERFAGVCEGAGAARPNAFTDANAMLAAMQGEMDAVYVSTPHVFHGANALAVVEAGYDLLLEKPMVTTQDEALKLAEAEQRTGRTIVIAFQGGLSPLIHDTRDRARRGDFGARQRQCLDLGGLEGQLCRTVEAGPCDFRRWLHVRHRRAYDEHGLPSG